MNLKSIDDFHAYLPIEIVIVFHETICPFVFFPIRMVIIHVQLRNKSFAKKRNFIKQNPFGCTAGVVG